MNFSAVQQFLRPLTDDEARGLARKHAGTPGIEQSVYLDEVGLQDLAVEVALEREHLALMIANDLAFLLAQELADDITAMLVREMPAQSDALLGLVDDIERASARWVSAWAKGEK